MQVSHANKICLVIISQDTNKNKRVSKKPQGFLNSYSSVNFWNTCPLLKQVRLIFKKMTISTYAHNL